LQIEGKTVAAGKWGVNEGDNAWCVVRGGVGGVLGSFGSSWHRDKSDISGGSVQFSVVKCSVKHWDGGGWRKLVRLDVNSGAHGVTRPTSHGLAAMRGVIVG